MQVCLDKPLHCCLYVSALVIKIYFAQKTCLVLFAKPFPLFKLKSVLYSYCSTEQISHVCSLPWFVSEEAPRFVFVWRGIVAMKYVNQNEDSDGDIILVVQSMCFVPILFKITLYFQGFSRKKVKFQFRKVLVTCHTRKLRKVETSDSLLTTGKNKPWQKKPADSTQKLWFYFEPCISW